MSDDDHLAKGKSIISKQRASNWELHDGAEDGYFDEEKDSPADPEDNMTLSSKDHHGKSDPRGPPTTSMISFKEKIIHGR